jgi:hypothetical protein
MCSSPSINPLIKFLFERQFHVTLDKKWSDASLLIIDGFEDILKYIKAHIDKDVPNDVEAFERSMNSLMFPIFKGVLTQYEIWRREKGLE